MSLSRIITEIWWEPSQGFDVRAETHLSDATKIRLDPSDHKIKLKLQSNFEYPTDADLHVRSRTYEPEAVRRLLMLQVNASHTLDEDRNPLTSVHLRLYDGTDEWYWNGATWAVAGASDWNTEDEVNQNISTFDVATSRKFAAVVNLFTSDKNYTPVLESVYVLWEGRVDWSQDLVLDSLTRMLQDEAVFTTDAALPPLESASATIDLDDYVDESDLDLVGMDGVFDHTADPNHLSDLLDSYDAVGREVTLSASIAQDHVPYLRMRARAEVAWDTHQDFEEVGKLPQVILGDTETVRSSTYPLSGDSSIIRKDTLEAVKVPAPYRMTYQITMEIRTDRSREQQRLLDSLLRTLVNGPTGEIGPFLRSRATDRRYRMWLLGEFRAVRPIDNSADVRVFRTEFRVEDVALDLRTAQDTFAVSTLKMHLDKVASDAEQQAVLDGRPVPAGGSETIEVTQ